MGGRNKRRGPFLRSCAGGRERADVAGQMQKTSKKTLVGALEISWFQKFIPFSRFWELIWFRKFPLVMGFVG